MQQIFVVFVLILYAAFAFDPVLQVAVIGRLLQLSPGELATGVLVLGIFIKVLVRNRPAIIQRPPPVFRFLLAYVLLAVVFFVPTLLFFIQHNDLAQHLPRSIFLYLKWFVALVLFYYGSDSHLTGKQLRLVVWLLMGAFIIGVFSSILTSSGANLFSLIGAMLTSQNMRLGGQIADPNELGSLAALFSVFGIMGALSEKEFRHKVVFAGLTVVTLFVILLTQSREALITLFVAVWGIFLLMIWNKRIVSAFMIFSGLILGTVFSVLSIPRIAQTITAITVGDTGYALSARDSVWDAALEIIATNPLGIGYENMYYLTDNLIGQAHNMLLQSAVVAGVFGFFSFVAFLAFLFRMLWQQGKQYPENWMLKAYFVFTLGYLASSMGSDHFISFDTFNSIFFGLLGFVACTRTR